MKNKELVILRVFPVFWVISFLAFYSYFLSREGKYAEQIDQLVVADLSMPVGLAFAPDNTLYIIEKGGEVKLYRENTGLQKRLFAKLTADTSGLSGESGLLGVAIDPNYESNKYIYFFYTHRASRKAGNQMVVRFTAQVCPDGAIVADPKSEVVILDNIPTTGRNHHGGGIAFGPDGKLYVSVGDGGSGNRSSESLDPQSPDNWWGKILRINPVPDPKYKYPSDNPFYDGGNPDSLRNAVFCIGIRNTFGIAFSPLGELFGAENGGTKSDTKGFDQINIYRKGKNYGWPLIYGLGPNGPDNIPPNYEEPIVLFSEKTSIVPAGIAFYSLSKLDSDVSPYPELDGCALVCIFLESGKSKIKKIRYLVDRKGYEVTDFADTTHKGPLPVGIAVASDGSIYYTSYSKGTIRRITYISKTG